MASSKDAFEPKTFSSSTFACGTWRGLGAAAALVGQWANVITLTSKTGPITLKANTGPYILGK